MATKDNVLKLKITKTDKVCGIGEHVGPQLQNEGKIPVFSCEGGCIKGEIARLAANLVAKEDRYARACHGALFSTPHSAIAEWIREADQVVVIDGCLLHCHGRIAEHIIDRNKLVMIDALSVHKKYANLMDVDDVPEAERQETARKLADKVLAHLDKNRSNVLESYDSCGCEKEFQAETKCAA
jgi:uncharacterized metal-binding protein